MKLPISLVVIACNEEDRIGRCLDSASFCDDRLVVVDDRSRDATEATAAARGARVVVHPYRGNIEQKRFAVGLARHRWVLSLDADEALSEQAAEEIAAQFRGGEPAVAGFELDRLTWHLGRWIRHGDFHPDWQLRLFRRDHARLEGVNPHGRVVCDGPVVRLRGPLYHWSYRDLADQVQRIQDFSSIQARELAARGQRAGWRQLLLHPPLRFLRAYLLRAGFRDGVPGLVIAVATAFHVFLKYAKLWEIERAGTASAPSPAPLAAGEGRGSPPAEARAPAAPRPPR